MKKIALLSVFFIGGLTSFAQVTPPKKEIDKVYYKNKDLIYKVIKTEKVEITK